MKNIFLLIALLSGFCPYLWAQHMDIETQKKVWRQMVADTITHPADDIIAVNGGKLAPRDSLIAPPSIRNFSEGLHQGLNVNVSASAFATFGHNTPHRGGLSQDVDLSYIAPLTHDGKLWMNIGGYMDHTNWGDDHYYDAGIYGMLDYNISEHWDAYVYGQLNLTNNNQYLGYTPGYYGYMPGYYNFMPGSHTFNSMWTYGMGPAGANVIGGGVRYHNKKFSLAINVEADWFNNNPYYFDQYNYPVPGI